MRVGCCSLPLLSSWLSRKKRCCDPVGGAHRPRVIHSMVGDSKSRKRTQVNSSVALCLHFGFVSGSALLVGGLRVRQNSNNKNRLQRGWRESGLDSAGCVPPFPLLVPCLNVANPPISLCAGIAVSQGARQIPSNRGGAREHPSGKLPADGVTPPHLSQPTRSHVYP